MRADDRPTRRAVLAGAVIVPLAACTRGGPPGPAPSPSRVDPDVALRAAARGRERDLVVLYDRLLVSAPAAQVTVLAALRAEHVVHLGALGGTATPEPSPPTAPATVGPAPDVRAAEAAVAAAHGEAVLQASRELAAVLAQLAAAEASHAVALA